MRVVWTYEAKKSFDGIFDYLMIVWSQKEAIAFIDLVEATIEKIKSYPKLFKISNLKIISAHLFARRRLKILRFRHMNAVHEKPYLRGVSSSLSLK